MGMVLLGSLLSAIAMFLWGFVWWVALPLKFLVLKAMPEQETILDTLRALNLESGAYFIPFVDETKVTSENKAETMKLMMEKHKTGPLVQITYRKSGMDMAYPLTMVPGFVQMFVSSLLVGVLLWMGLAGLTSYGERLLFVFIVNVFATISIDLSAPLWFHHPWGLPLYNAGFHLSCGVLSGLILAALIAPAT
jgi:hypothetical protein